MKIISTNLSNLKTVQWKGKSVTTGIFKEPVNEPLALGTEDVLGDTVVDRQYHGGVDQACYLYGTDQYEYWKGVYPDKDLPYGMFGENLTVEGLDETQLDVGATYKVGAAVVQISAPRQPCYKLGIRFEDQGVLKRMINSTYCGSYVRVLKVGEVNVGDEFQLIENQEGGLTIAEVFTLIYADSIDPAIKQKLLADTHLPDKLKVKLVSRHGAR